MTTPAPTPIFDQVSAEYPEIRLPHIPARHDTAEVDAPPEEHRRKEGGES